jgi:hypothetical protein
MWWPTGAGTSRLLEGLTPGTYYWQAKVQTGSEINEAGGGTWWNFTVSGAGGFIKLGPTDGVSGLTSDVLLQWSSIPDSGYWVCWDTIDNGACDTMWWPNGAGTTRPVAGLEPGTYYWQARAQTGSQWSDANGGTWWSFTVGTPAVSFSKRTPAPGAILTSNAALLSWSPVAGASFYEVCVDIVNNQLCDAVPRAGTGRRNGLRPSRRAGVSKRVGAVCDAGRLDLHGSS